VTKPERRGILDLLDSKSKLKTPAFQRSFAWGRAQIDDFWTDLKRALDTQTGPADYFLGLIVLDSTDQIQDGQQRLATTLLLASEMYRLLDAAKAAGAHDQQLAIDVEGQITPALRQSPSAPLVISPQDQDVLLNRAGIRADSPESTRRLAVARATLGKHLVDDLTSRRSPDARLGRLKQWASYLSSQAYVVVLRVPPKDAHNIFETLNTRGIRLSNGDLVKSHLISRATDTNLAIAKWNSVTGALKDAKGKYEDDLETFLLHYHGSRYGRTTKAQFFVDYRKAIMRSDVLAALDELIESAALYRALAAPEASTAFWSSIGAGTQQAVEVLNALALKQLRYVLLAVLRDFGGARRSTARRKNQRNAVLKLTAWSIRGLVTGRTGGGEAERTYITAALEIVGGGFKTVADLKKHFLKAKMLIVDDSVFEAQFRAFPFDRPTTHKRARAILYALEYERIGNKSGLKPRETLTVEHVLPKSPAAGQWTGFSDDARRAFTYQLGNLLLIDGPSGANNQLANKEWLDKKQLIKTFGPQTPLTAEALKRRDWGVTTIENRTGDLAKLAVKTWSP
jgi:Protein of unknown function DUF262/Protein of unknown function (DUF1524)